MASLPPAPPMSVPRLLTSSGFLRRAHFLVRLLSYLTYRTVARFRDGLPVTERTRWVTPYLLLAIRARIGLPITGPTMAFPLSFLRPYADMRRIPQSSCRVKANSPSNRLLLFDTWKCDLPPSGMTYILITKSLPFLWSLTLRPVGFCKM